MVEKRTAKYEYGWIFGKEAVEKEIQTAGRALSTFNLIMRGLSSWKSAETPLPSYDEEYLGFEEYLGGKAQRS